MKSRFIKNFIIFLGLFFLYFPILVLIFYSFNENKRVMVWKGFSFKWYGELFKNEQIIEAFIVSIKIASFSATIFDSSVLFIFLELFISFSIEDDDKVVMFLLSSIICAEIFFVVLEMLSLNLSFEANLFTLLVTLNFLRILVVNFIIFSFPLFSLHTDLFL